MQENKYDDADFFANYQEMPRSVAGLQRRPIFLLLQAVKSANEPIAEK